MSMDRELLHHFLRAGPARKFDVNSVTRQIERAHSQANDLLFRSSYFNTSILFKFVNLDDYYQTNVDRSIDMLVYLPYDRNNPGEGGESFVLCERNFWGYFQSKLRRSDAELPALRADYKHLLIFDSVPTFSPFILELAFERKGIAVPKSYVDLPPDLRLKLQEHIKGRIRPLTVAAFEQTGTDPECAIEELTNRLFALRNIDDIRPLIRALMIPEDESI